MKIRFDHVTNSSSSSFIVRVGVRLNNDEEVKYEAFAEDDGGGCDYGVVKVNGNLFEEASKSGSIDDLIALLEKAVSYNYAEDGEYVTSDHYFDSKDFELYSDVKEKSYSRDDFVDGAYYDGDDDPDDGRSVPFSKGVVIFDKEIKNKAKTLDDIKSITVESIRTASGEFIDPDDFEGLNWDEDGIAAECVSLKEMNLKNGEISEKTSAEWL